MAEQEREGYVRVVRGADPEAVAWWYFRDFGDGFVFARGGRVATSRKARTMIHGVSIQAKREHREWERRGHVGAHLNVA